LLKYIIFILNKNFENPSLCLCLGVIVFEGVRPAFKFDKIISLCRHRLHRTFVFSFCLNIYSALGKL